MKIISKYKDYYDYLTGIYGVDKKLILDRRDCELYRLPLIGKITLYIGGYIIEGLIKEDETILYGESLRQFIVDKSQMHIWHKTWLSTHTPRNYDKSFHIKYKYDQDWYYLEPIKDLENINKKHNCPILIKTYHGFKKYPKLTTLNLPSFVTAETIYQWLSEWLSNQITLKEQSQELNNFDKIEAKGFDKTRSFRPKMKK